MMGDLIQNMGHFILSIKAKAIYSDFAVEAVAAAIRLPGLFTKSNPFNHD